MLYCYNIIQVCSEVSQLCSKDIMSFFFFCKWHLIFFLLHISLSDRLSRQFYSPNTSRNHVFLIRCIYFMIWQSRKRIWNSKVLLEELKNIICYFQYFKLYWCSNMWHDKIFIKKKTNTNIKLWLFHKFSEIIYL